MINTVGSSQPQKCTFSHQKQFESKILAGKLIKIDHFDQLIVHSEIKQEGDYQEIEVIDPNLKKKINELLEQSSTGRKRTITVDPWKKKVKDEKDSTKVRNFLEISPKITESHHIMISYYPIFSEQNGDVCRCGSIIWSQALHGICNTA